VADKSKEQPDEKSAQDANAIVGYKVRFATMVFVYPIRLGSGRSHSKKIVSLSARHARHAPGMIDTAQSSRARMKSIDGLS
jgi:hypothetical protein